MKKLMFAAVAATIVGGAFAEPLVYDYKASVKHMYEKLQRTANGNIYVKYIKSAKLQGYFVQDFDATTALANNELAGTAVSQKKGFLVLINKSAEKDFRAPKIMPAQLDVKTAVTSASASGATTKTKVIAEAYFYAGPFAAFPDAANAWDPSQDDGLDYMFNNGAANGGPGVRAYGTVGSTLYLFGQHNTYNRFDNTGAQPATLCAFGDAWMNGAGFGKGSGSTSLCCGWGSFNGGFGAISGTLKGGLFLCSISGYPANSALGYFALGLEDVFMSDVGALVLGKVVQGDFSVNPPLEDADQVTWADGDIALSTTDVVSGTWTLKPSSRLVPSALTAAEQATFGASAQWPAWQPVAEYIKAACHALDANYSLTTATEPSAVNGGRTNGLISPNFQLLYL